MITASEPSEFIPRGRQAVDEHSGPLVLKKPVTIPSDFVLLQRMQDVNISLDESPTEFYVLKEVNDSDHGGGGSSFLLEADINTEEELYVKGNTAVWTKGTNDEETAAPHVCLTCDSPIKFAFFCNEQFLSSADEKPNSPLARNAACLMDGSSLKVYCSNGENFVTSIETPVSNVWVTKHGILLEKESSRTLLEAQSIPLPRLFSLSHPLDEMCPVLIRINNSTSYITEAEYHVVFTCADNALALLFDEKIGKHIVCFMRKVTEDEIQSVGCCVNDGTTTCYTSSVFDASINASSSLPRTPLPTAKTTPQSFYKNSLLARHNASTSGRPSIGASYGSPYESNLQAGHVSSFNMSTTGGYHSILQTQQHHHGTHGVTEGTTPLARLQSTLGGSVSLIDVRKIGQAEPSKPIIPEFCLEHVWTEHTSTWKESHEKATVGFLHTDLIGSHYLCYLLPRSEELNIVRLGAGGDRCLDPVQMADAREIARIPAKDAVCLERLNMIAVLAPCGTLVLYSGPVQVGKVHVAGVLSSFATSSALSNSFSSSLGFPRRSSLLPTIPAQDATPHFDEELHMLSPVQPLHALSNPLASAAQLNNCQRIRDGSGNRVTLVFSNEKMFRIAIPLITECQLVARCLEALRHILPSGTALEFIIFWYGTRNAPGSKNFDSDREWEIFCSILLQNMGRTCPLVEADQHGKSPYAKSSFAEHKKRRRNDNGSGADSDWEYLHAHSGKEQTAEVKSDKPVCTAYNPDKLLFPYVPNILFALHLVYEDLKLDPLLSNDQKRLAHFLYKLALDLKLEKFQLHYFLDYQHLTQLSSRCFVRKEDSIKFVAVSDNDFEHIPNIFQYIHKLIADPNSADLVPYPCMDKINNRSRDMILIVAYLYRARGLSKWVAENLASILKPEKLESVTEDNSNVNQMVANVVITVLIERGYNRFNIEKLPVSLHYLISQFLETNRNSLLNDYEARVYELLLRPELYAHVMFDGHAQKTGRSKKHPSALKEHSLYLRRKLQPDGVSKPETKQEESGMENIDTKLLRLRFPDDLRINDVKAFLNSSQPVTIDITQAPSVSDHEFIEEQEKQLYALCIRTMALPIGRGMFTLRTSRPTPTQTLPIPKLCLTGKEVVRGATIEIQQLEVPPNMNLWPMFHNGVAAGLRICSDTPDIDSTWITYNKPKGLPDIPTEHAGFLMALGLNGHLKTLSFMSIYEYLVKCDEMTSLGLLLGISATHRGTMDTKTTKLLSVHIEALLPPTAVELDISQNIQVASLMGIGLVYQATAKRHIAEVLLQEIGRPPGPEMENYVDRESYALTAGLALGLVTLEQGEHSAALRDLNIPDTLHYYMVGGNKRGLAGAQKEKYKLPSFQIKEGDTVNIDVTAPGATLALGLMYFGTGNEAVANWMKPPDTTYLLDFIRPDLLLLRIVARNLIMWNSIEPSTEWVYKQIPQSLSSIIENRLNEQVQLADHEAQCQAYCNIVCGAAICIGLKHAGTADEKAFGTLRYLLNYFLEIHDRPLGDFAGKQTIENCTIVILLAASMVLAGTGDVRLLRAIRMLRSRYGQCHVTYGSHMAVHMALGFLFLGAGRYTLSRSPPAIAALICSIFPKFPIHSNDNRYHLQAFRHLYVLAIEPRLFLPRDIDSGKLCLCEIHYLEQGKNVPIKMMAPCMLPELNTLTSVYVTDSNYWHVHFDKKNWRTLENILKANGCIDVKQRAGCLSYLEDPNRLKSMLTQTLTTDKYNSWKIDTKSLLAFSADQRTSSVANRFLLPSIRCGIDESESVPTSDRDIMQILMLQTYDCLTHDKMHGLSIFMDLINLTSNLDSSCNSSDLMQFRILAAIISRKRAIAEPDVLVSQDMIQSMVDRVQLRMEKILQENAELVRCYVIAAPAQCPFGDLIAEVDARHQLHLAMLITFYELPIKILNDDMMKQLGMTDYLQFISGFRKQFPTIATRTVCSMADVLGLKKF